MRAASITVKAVTIIKMPIFFIQLGGMVAKPFTCFPSDSKNMRQIHNPITENSFFMSDYLTLHYLYFCNVFHFH